jgi:hypothetical protein
LYYALLTPDFQNPLSHNFINKHLWVKKAIGLGVTEFFLRVMPGYVLEMMAIGSAFA